MYGSSVVIWWCWACRYYAIVFAYVTPQHSANNGPEVQEHFYIHFKPKLKFRKCFLSNEWRLYKIQNYINMNGWSFGTPDISPGPLSRYPGMQSTCCNAHEHGEPVDNIYGIPIPNTPPLSLRARFMGPTWGPSGADMTQVGPMLAPWPLLSGTRLTDCTRH